MKYKSQAIEINGIKTYYDGYLQSNFDLMKKSASLKFDNVLIIDGPEGVGKTTLSIEACWYLTDGKFTIDDIVFTPKQFFAKIKTAKPGSAILFDEFIMSGLSTEAFNKVQAEIIKMLTVIRKRKLYIILVIPYFFMLRKYFALARSKCLIHVYTPDGMDRGYFQFFNYIQKKMLFLKGKMDYKYNVVDCSFRGRFYNTAWNIINEKAYDKKKEEAISMIGMSEGQLLKVANMKETLDFIKYIMLNEHALFQRVVNQRNRGYELLFGRVTTNFTPLKIDQMKKWVEIKLQENIDKHMEAKFSTVKALAKLKKKDMPEFNVWSETYMETIMNDVIKGEKESVKESVGK